MRNFTELFLGLDRTTKTNDKLDLLKSYFLTAPPADRVWAIALFTGRRPPRIVSSALIRQWAMEESGIPQWLFYESYLSVGDLAETISLLLPVSVSTSQKTLSEWFLSFLSMNEKPEEIKRNFIVNAWKELSPYEIFVFNKLLMGSFRIGVSQTLLIKAIGLATGVESSVIAHRVMGKWDPALISYDDLIHAEHANDNLSKPYPFYLAYAIEDNLEDLGDPEEWFTEWKWDGIRSQIIIRKGQIFIWSRGEDLITDKFPELVAMKNSLPDGIVLDGEIVCYENGRPLPFNILQTRIGRKNITRKILEEAPVSFICYDILELENVDLRKNSQEERRKILEGVLAKCAITKTILLSPLILFKNWEDLRQLHHSSRENSAEGFMIKRKSAPYKVGRKKGDWWKWKVDPLSVDAVMIYAQKGHGRRAELYTDYTFGVWLGDKLIPFAKAYSGLTDKEIEEVDSFVRRHTIEKFGPVRTVKPELVFEIGFEGINKSSRHKSGIAVRFPRILRWRKDKPAAEADTLDNLKKILEVFK
jgi:DNA ligase-1